MIIKKLVSLLAAAVMITGAGSALWEYPPYIEAQAVTEAQSDHSELLDMCRGRYAYNELGERDNGANLKQFYDRLFDAYSKVWTDGKNYTPYQPDSDMYVIGKVKYNDLGLSIDDALACYCALKYDNPAMYYLVSRYATNDTTFFALIDNDYIKASTRAALQQDIYDYVTDMTSAVSGLTRRYERALILHDKILPVMTYNHDDMEANYSHNIIGAVENKTGVCECYSKIYQLLLNYVGIDNFLVIGRERDSGGGHEWNAVKMDDGRYYFIDVTWDDKKDTHRYFAKGYTLFNEKHIIYDPVETGSNYYYAMPSNIQNGDYSCQANNPTLYNQMGQFSFYVKEDNTITIVSYIGNSSKVTVPASILDLPVTEIGDDAFFNVSDVTEIELPEGIKTIGDGAFFHTLRSGKKMTIPKSVTKIGTYAVGYKATKTGSSYQYDGDYAQFSPGLITSFTITCYAGSEGYRYAVANGIKYVLLDPPEPEYETGDANRDGQVNLKDVTLLKQYLAKWNVDIDLDLADVNGDNDVNLRDITLLCQALANWNVTLAGSKS